MMSDPGSIVRIYELGKAGRWDEVTKSFDDDPLLAGHAVRYVRESSGWSLLHQACFWGNRDAVALCLKYGADPSLVTNDSQTAPQVAAWKGYSQLSTDLLAALSKCGSLWRPTSDPRLQASSCIWNERIKCVAAKDFSAGYGGGEVHITAGETYFADSWGRVLVGWHGTTNPPSGMDGESML
jgi:uncharacterized protein